MGLIRIAGQLFQPALPGKHQDGGQPVADPGGDIRIQPVSHHGRFLTQSPGPHKGIVNDPRVGLAQNDIRVPAGRGGDKGFYGPDIRDKAGS